MTDYKPGTVAVATVRGVPNQRVWFWGDRLRWLSAAPVKDTRIHHDEQVTDIRPLIVLDVKNPERFAEDLRWSHEEWSSRDFDKIADQVEAQTSPPRIPEPGLYRVVLAGPPHDRMRWVRGPKGWTNVDATGSYLNWSHWTQLIDPELVES